MYNSQINIRYAKSLFLLAEEKNISDEIKKDVELILQWYEEYEDIKVVLEHPVLKPTKKYQILSDLLKDKVNAYTLSLLKLIIKNKRENHLKNICINFIDIYKKQKGIKTAVLTTAFELTRTHKSNIKKSIENIFSAEVELKTKVHKELLGGMLIQVDDKQLDLSVAGQVQKLRNQFLNIDFNNKKKNKTLK
jgi:F-type H+-transporting ATPase subunit delta